jgi:hypothetical protein
MNCDYHPAREAISTCVECGKPVCPECKVEYEGKTYCTLCIEKKVISAAAATAQTVPATDTGNTSGMGSKAVVPPGLGEWNWGGFLLTWIWGIGNNVWWAFLVFVPYLGPLVMPWVLAFKGNEWAWQSKRWDSIEHFKSVQRTWMWWGLGVTIAITLLITVILIICIALMVWGIQRPGMIKYW